MLNATYASQCRSFLDRFVAFVREQYPKVSEVGQVSRSMALAFLEVESKWYIAGKTCTGKTSNDKLKLLRMAFGAALPVGHMNPLIGERMQQVKTVFGQPPRSVWFQTGCAQQPHSAQLKPPAELEPAA
jgi:hypothetical protein